MKAVINKNNQKRILYFDFLRIMATLAVIVLHVAAQNWSNVSITSYEWHVFNIVDSAVRWGVPVFVMISGSLLLDNDKALDIKRLYRHNIFRMVTAFVFWSAVYAINKMRLGADLKTVVTAFIQGNYHMWFLLMIIGLYIVVPILRQITECRKTTEYFLGVGFFFTFLIPRIINFFTCVDLSHTATLISAINSAFSKMNFHLTLGYVFYFLLGFYLSKYDISPTMCKIGYVAGGASYLATVLLTIWYSNKLGSASSIFYSEFSINVMLMSVSIFLLGKYVLSKISMKGRKLGIIINLSESTFGIYLVHILVLEKFSSRLCLSTLTFDPIISIVMIVVGVGVVSYIVSAVLNHIPILKKYVV